MAFSDFVDSHSTLLIGAGVLAVLVIGGQLIGKKDAVSGSGAGQQDLSGLQNGNIVYVPTQTTFSTENVGQDFSNDPSLTSVTTGNTAVNSPTTGGTTTTTTVTVNPTPTPPTNGNPPPVQKPPATTTPPPPAKSAPAKHYQLVWGAIHVVTTDDTNQGMNALNHIASQSTMIMQTQQHAPSNVSINANDIKSHNPGLTLPLKLGTRIKLPSWALA